MFSAEGESVSFSLTINTPEARGSVEKWLLQVQDVMLLSVRDVIEEAIEVSTAVCLLVKEHEWKIRRVRFEKVLSVVYQEGDK